MPGLMQFCWLTLSKSFSIHSLDILRYKSSSLKLKTKAEKLKLYKALFNKENYPHLITSLNMTLMNNFVGGIYSNLFQPKINKIIQKKYSYIKNPFLNRIVSNSMSGLVFGSILGAIVHPFDYVRLKLIASRGIIKLNESTIPFKNVSDLIDKTYIQYGGKEFLTGIKATMLREGIGCFVSGMTMELLKTITKKKLKLWQQFIFGTIAYSANWAVTLPIDKVKTRMIVDTAREKRLFKNNIDCFQKLIQAEGVKGLYSGLSIILLRGVAVNLVAMICMKKCQKKKEE